MVWMVEFTTLPAKAVILLTARANLWGFATEAVLAINSQADIF